MNFLLIVILLPGEAGVPVYPTIYEACALSSHHSKRKGGRFTKNVTGRKSSKASANTQQAVQATEPAQEETAVSVRPSARASSYSLRARSPAEPSQFRHRLPSPSPPRKRLPRVNQLLQMLPSSQSSMSSVPPSQESEVDGIKELRKKKLVSVKRDRLHMRNRQIKRMALNRIPIDIIARTWGVSQFTVRRVLRQRFISGTSWGPRRSGKSLTAVTQAATQSMLQEVEKNPIQSLRR